MAILISVPIAAAAVLYVLVSSSAWLRSALHRSDALSQLLYSDSVKTDVIMLIASLASCVIAFSAIFIIRNRDLMTGSKSTLLLTALVSFLSAAVIAYRVAVSFFAA